MDRFSISLLTALTALVVGGWNSRGASAQQSEVPRPSVPLPLDATLFPDKSEYPPGCPVALRLAIKNTSNRVVQLTMEWGRLEEKIQFHRALGLSQPRLLARWKPGKTAVKQVPLMRTLTIEPGTAYAAMLPLAEYVFFEEAGDYGVSLDIGVVRVRVGEISTDWRPKIDARIRVLQEPSTDSAGATIDLVEPGHAGNRMPLLKWEIRPPPGIMLREPMIYDANCRVIIRDAKGRLLQEFFWNPAGSRPSPRERSLEPMKWALPLTMETFELPGQIFSGPGEYIVQASYRDCLFEDETTRESSVRGHALYVSHVKVAESERAATQKDSPDRDYQPEREFHSVELAQLRPAPVRWIAFSKTFTLKVSEEIWQGFKQSNNPSENSSGGVRGD